MIFFIKCTCGSGLEQELDVFVDEKCLTSSILIYGWKLRKGFPTLVDIR